MGGGERRLRILGRLVGAGAPELETKRLCEVCAEVTGMSGAGIMLMSGDVPRGSVCTTNEVSALIEQLQYDARARARAWTPTTRTGRCSNPTWPTRRRPGGSPSPGRRSTAGVRAVFGFPLQVGAVRLGALNLYCDRPGPLTDEQHADALVMADVAAQAVLVMQAERAARASWPPSWRRAPTSSTSCTRPRAWSPPSSTSASAKPSSGCGRTPSATTDPSPRWPRTWWPEAALRRPERREGPRAVRRCPPGSASAGAAAVVRLRRVALRPGTATWPSRR